VPELALPWMWRAVFTWIAQAFDLGAFSLTLEQAAR
jgi:hypothetical protein